jgi:dUTPase
MADEQAPIIVDPDYAERVAVTIANYQGRAEATEEDRRKARAIIAIALRTEELVAGKVTP